MANIRLIHWHAEGAGERAALLEALGHQVDSETPAGPVLLRALRDDPPDALVIDLDRLPAQGRDLGIAVRSQSATRTIPLVFVGGLPAKVEKVRALLPDAVFIEWSDIGTALVAALAAPPANPVVPGSVFAAYEGRPLAAKLAIKPGMAVGLVGAPHGFRATLGELPEGASVREGVGDGCELALWFARVRDELDEAVRAPARQGGPKRIWIMWAKKASGLQTDLTQQAVREAGLAAGLVDYKICSVDATWSGLLFCRRAGPGDHASRRRGLRRG